MSDTRPQDEEVSSLADDEATLSALQEENARLRQRLQEVVGQGAKERARRGKMMRALGGLLLPAFDRYKVVRNFVHLSRTATSFSGPKQDWPKPDAVVDAAESFAVSLLRFAIRRRFLWLVFTVVALLVPVVQLTLVYQQNRLVDLQNQLINTQVDDIVSRGVTTDNLLTNELNGALLAGREVQDLNRLLRRVFSAEMGEMMGGLDPNQARRLYLRGTAGRAHLLLALAESLRHPQSAETLTPAALWDIVGDPENGAFAAVVQEAARGRLSVTLRAPAEAFAGEDPKLEAECQRYMLGLANVLRRAWSIAVAAGAQESFYYTVHPLFARVAAMDAARSGPLLTAFVQTFREVLLDQGLPQRFGRSDPPLPRDVDGTIKKGFGNLQAGLKATGLPEISYDKLRRLLKVGA